MGRWCAATQSAPPSPSYAVICLTPAGRVGLAMADSVAAAEAAVTVLEPLGTSTELARAYARPAIVRLLNGEHQAAIELAVRAQVIAEPLGALDALSEALNTQGCSVAMTGGEWTGYLRRALKVAPSARNGDLILATSWDFFMTADSARGLLDPADGLAASGHRHARSPLRGGCVRTPGTGRRPRRAASALVSGMTGSSAPAQDARRRAAYGNTY